jgi:signal peptidase I
MTEKKGRRRKRLREWLRILLIAIGALWLLRVFVMQSYMVPDTRMEKNLLQGDYVLITKTGFGARLPITVLSIPFLDQYLPFTTVNSWVDWIQLPVMRMPGFTDIEKGDLLLINYPLINDVPLDKKDMVLKRCIGLPGDTIAITDKKIFLNGILFPDPPGTKYRYRVVGTGPLSAGFLKKLGITEGALLAPPAVYDLYIDRITAEILQKDTTIRQATPVKMARGLASIPYFPLIENFGWNLDYFGPLYIPAKGDTLHINLNNIALYKKIIEVYEENTVTIGPDTVLINDKPAPWYIVRKNYYFVMDDNRDLGRDRRNWGFLPEDHIVGKAAMIWFSYGPEGFRWDRTMKTI